MKHIFETAFELPLPLETVFEFFSAAANLEKITPPDMGFRLITAQPLEIAEGTEIDYRIRIAGLPLRWRSRISRWAPPHAFTDEQLRGPYKLWEHTHTFETTPRGTIIRDSVVYALPFAPLGEIGHFFVRKQLERIFAYREQAIRATLLS